jgi:hypothetical protein
MCVYVCEREGVCVSVCVRTKGHKAIKDQGEMKPINQAYGSSWRDGPGWARGLGSTASVVRTGTAPSLVAEAMARAKRGKTRQHQGWRREPGACGGRSRPARRPR